LIAGIEAIVDDQGKTIGSRAFRPEDIYRSVRGVAPDLIVYFGDLAWRSVGAVGMGGIHTFENDTGRTGEPAGTASSCSTAGAGRRSAARSPTCRSATSRRRSSVSSAGRCPTASPGSRSADAVVRTVAVDILTGFLGSGKTTLLRHVLAHGLDGKPVAVIMNEIGEVGIDGRVVTGLANVEKMVELSSGCICCSIDDYKFDLAIQEIIDTAKPHLVIIESTGSPIPSRSPTG
jgi:hypothetical protein